MSIDSRRARELYANRCLESGHPEIEIRRLAAKADARHRQPDKGFESVDSILACVVRAASLPARERTAVVVGCGPFPTSVRRLRDIGWACVGVEPVEEYADAARQFLSYPHGVLVGSAESLPVDSASTSLVIMESVLEHVDSAVDALREAFRVLRPGGVLYVGTTNRLQLSNAEYTLRFFQWLPGLVRESYIHQHLHFEPHLARYSSRPAVNWFTYAELCAIGRTSGFYRFYSKLDLLAVDDPTIRRSAVRRRALDRVRFNPWLRALALTQKGGTVFMLKRG